MVERRWRVVRVVQQAVEAVEAVERRWRVPRVVQQAVAVVKVAERRRRVPRMVQSKGCDQGVKADPGRPANPTHG